MTLSGESIRVSPDATDSERTQLRERLENVLLNGAI
jgi:hypothetical protein